SPPTLSVQATRQATSQQSHIQPNRAITDNRTPPAMLFKFSHRFGHHQSTNNTPRLSWQLGSGQG
ncbi:unnamed protein product, partial [Ceratitis capitata]